MSVLDLTISVVNRKLRAATHGNGVYQIDLLENPISTDIPSLTSSTDRYLNIYPNPSNGIFNIEFNINISGDVNIKVIDITGRIIYSDNKKVLKGKNISSIDLNNKYSPGIYLVSLRTDDMDISKQLILK